MDQHKKFSQSANEEASKSHINCVYLNEMMNREMIGIWEGDSHGEFQSTTPKFTRRPIMMGNNHAEIQLTARTGH
jgi:uncharacterized protein YukE